MRFEHFALNVPAPHEMALWYAEHLGFRILRQSDTGSLAHFLGDDSGRICLELYRNPAAPIPDYAAQPPLVFHFAVATAERRPSAPASSPPAPRCSPRKPSPTAPCSACSATPGASPSSSASAPRPIPALYSRCHRTGDPSASR